MNKLVFEGMTIRDFGVLEDERLNFAQLGNGVHFVRGQNEYRKRMGSNGAGKTTIWNAMSWCLFGRTMSGLRTGDVVPWDSDRIPYVRTDFMHGARAHTVEREGKTNGLTLDGKKVSQERVDEALGGLSYTTFPHTIVLGQGQPLFFDLDPRSKMEVLSDGLKLDRWEERSKRAGLKHRKLEQQITSLDVEIKGLERSIDENEDTLADLRTKEKEWERERNNRVEDRARQLRVSEKALVRSEKEWGEWDLKYDSAETELRASQRELDKATAVATDAATKVAGEKAALRVLDAELDRVQAMIDDIGESDECPTCGALLKTANRKQHRRELQTQWNSAKADRDKGSKLIDEMIRLRESAETRVAQHQKDIRAFLVKSNEAIDSRARADETRQQLKAAVAQLKRKDADDDNATNPYSELVNKARAQIKALEQTIDDATKLLEQAQRKAERVKYWVQGFKQVRLYLLEEVLDELEAVTATLLPSIGLEDWTVRFDMEKELKSGDTRPGLVVTIAQPGIKQEAIKWEAWSSGEGQRLRLIGAIALSEVLLRRTGVTCDLMVLDEPTRHMSPQGVRETIDFILERGRNAQVMYTDHAAINTSRFASTIDVVRTGRYVAHIKQERLAAA